MNLKYLALTLTVFLLLKMGSMEYSPTWESLDSRPLPAWYDEAKFGILVHWGVYSAADSESDNWHKNERQSNHSFQRKYNLDSYKKLGNQFTAKYFNPLRWTNVLKESGARYVVLTSKDYDGFTLWPSKYASEWNSLYTGPYRNLIADLAGAIRERTNIKFGVYYSLFEWFNQLYERDKENDFRSQLYVQQKLLPELRELVQMVQPSIIWSDGCMDADEDYWKSKEFLTWLYNDSPVKDDVVVNDRWGKNIKIHHGGFCTWPGHFDWASKNQSKWERVISIDKYSWSYRQKPRTAEFRKGFDLLKELITTISNGGNLMINIGPSPDGRMPREVRKRLRALGKWLKVNSEAVYSTRPWTSQNDCLSKGVWYTMTGGQTNETFVYAIILESPYNDKLRLRAPKLSEDSVVSILGTNVTLEWKMYESVVNIKMIPKSLILEKLGTLKLSNVIGDVCANGL